MADIFISYSKADRLIVEQLAAFLEAEGWSVWWDKSLTAGDTYRDEIMRELAAARAVISVWTPTSITSDWVRAEAGRSKADGKLIPVKTADVGYDRIPLPFGEMHTEPVENRAQIRAAVVAQLARPAATPKGLWMAWAETRYAIITWIGIIGGAITLFSNFKGVIQFADWARVLVENWQAWTHAVWKALFGWIGIRVAAIWYPSLTFLAFILTTIFAGRLALSLKRRSARLHDAATSGLRFDHWLAVSGICLLGVALVVAPMAMIVLAPDFLKVPEVVFQSALIVCYGLLLALITYAARERWAALAYVMLFLPFPILLILLARPTASTSSFAGQPHDLQLSAYAVSAFFLTTPAFIILTLAALPARVLNRRFLFLLIGLGLLLGLNELAKLELWRHVKT